MSKFEFSGLITVRTSSERLPKKCLLPFGKDNIITHIIKRTESYDIEPIVCTSIEKSDDVIEKICYELGVKIFRGSRNNKIKRWSDCTSFFNIEHFHTIDADDPFFDGNEMKRSMSLLKKNNLDIVEPYKYSTSGAGILGYSFLSSYLSEICNHLDDEVNTEHIPDFIYDNNNFKKETILPLKITNLKMRLTLDYEEDYTLLSSIRLLLGNNATRDQINNLFERNPDLHKINWFRQIDYLKRQNS